MCHDNGHFSDPAGLLRVGTPRQVASDNDLVVRVERRIGNFVPKTASLILAFPYGRLSDAVADDLSNTFSFGPERTPQYDIEFSLRRIVEIAQPALSRGVNDPTTALYCLDRLGEMLGLLAERQFPSGRIVDQDRKLRVVFEPVTFAELACLAFAAIARYGISDDGLVARLLDVMEKCSRSAPTSERKIIMRLHDVIRVKNAGLRWGDAMQATQPSPA